MSALDEEDGRSRSSSSSSSGGGGGGGGGGAQQRERSATFACSKCLELLGLLRSAKHAGRIKALRRFQEYMQQFKPEFYDDDVELLLVGSASLDGLVPWCGYKSSHARGEEALKTTSRAVLHLLHWLVAIYKDGEASSGGSSSMSSSNVFLDKFLELPPALLEKMELGMHVRAAAGDADGATEAFELLSLLLMRHKGPDADAGNGEDGAAGGGKIVRLEGLLPEPEAQGHFTRWLQQSTCEQQLIDRVNEEQRAALVAAASSAAASASKAPPGLPLGTTAGGGAGAGAASGPSLDPLGLYDNLDLVAAEQLREQSSAPGAAGGKGVGALLGAKDRMFLLQRLQQAALGGGQGSAAGAAAGKGAARGAKYTRNKTRALKSAAAAGHGAAAASASIVPQDEAFDPALFLTIVHGASSFEDLRRGQENLEKGLSTQAGQLQQLVRQHYDAFARCAEGIQWFRHMVEEEFFREGGGSGAGGGGGGEGAKIAHLLEIVAGTQEGARELFRPLLERMDSARNLRAARLLLQRLARVLDVPGRMAQLEAQGRYEEVVREYERVRTLPSGPGPGSRAGLLGRVQLQAQAVADRLRARLRAYVGAAAHPFEDLVQAADLLARLGPGKGAAGAKGGGQGQNQEAEEQEQEPLLFMFARQAELLGKGLDALEAWYAKGLQAIGERKHPSQTGGWQQRSSRLSRDENAADEEEDDADVDDSMEDESLPAAARPSAALGAIGGPGKDKEDVVEDDPMLYSPLSRFGGVVDDGLGSSPRFGVDSVERRASSFRLQCTRRLARLGLRSLPTLLRMAALVAEELADVRVVWVPGQYGFYVTSSSPSGKWRLATGTSAGQQQRTAASAALEQVGFALQRISKAMHRAMFGEGGRATQLPSRSPRQQQQQQQQQQPAAATSVADSVRHRPLDPVYFREALRAAAQLYEGFFALQQQEKAVSAVDSTSMAELATAVLPPLRSLVEDAQRRQAQSVLDRVGEGAVLRLCQREDWTRCSGWHAAAGTNLPQAFQEMATLALEDLVATLPRPSWCAAQVAQGLDRALTRLLAALAALADGGAAPASLVPRPRRLLALVGNCVQLHGLVLPSLAAAAQRFFEAEASSLAGPEAKGRVLALHDDCLRLYLEDKIVALEAALRDGWIVKGKGLAGVLSATGAGGQGAAMVPPRYLSRVLLLLVQAKAETRELLGERALLTEDEGDGEEDEGPQPMGEVMARPPLYVDAVTSKLAQAAVTGLTARAAEFGQSLRSALASSHESRERARQRRQQVGALAHCASVEAIFLVGALRPFVTAESTQAAKKRLEPLKLIAVDALRVGVDEDGLEDVTAAAAAAAIEEYTCASVEKALRVYVASLQ